MLKFTIVIGLLQNGRSPQTAIDSKGRTSFIEFVVLTDCCEIELNILGLTHNCDRCWPLSDIDISARITIISARTTHPADSSPQLHLLKLSLL
jgi:hypothetical protein